MTPLLLRSALIVVRPTAADVLDDEGRVVLTGHPSTPASWKDSAHGPWSQTVTPGGVIVNARRLGTVTDDPTLGIWHVVQDAEGTAALQALASAPGNVYAGTLKATWIVARGGSPVMRDLLRHLPEWKVSGFIAHKETGEPVAITEERLILDGAQRIPPDALTGAGPWHLDATGAEVPHGDPSETLHVTTWHRPALMATVTGYLDHEPEDGTPE